MSRTLTFTVERKVYDVYKVELSDQEYADLVNTIAKPQLQYEDAPEYIEDVFYNTIPAIKKRDWVNAYIEDGDYTDGESLVDDYGSIIENNDDFEELFNKAQQISVLLTDENA